MSDETLKPCPFCGSSAKLRRLRADGHSFPSEYDVSCNNLLCNMETHAVSSADKAAALWNRRDTSELEALRAAVREYFEACSAYLQARQRWYRDEDSGDEWMSVEAARNTAETALRKLAESR